MKWKVWFEMYEDRGNGCKPKWYTASAEWATEKQAIEHAQGKSRAWTNVSRWCVMKKGENPNEKPANILAS